MSKLVFVNGDIFNTNCEAIVCPVNSVGVMGAGMAKLFREKFNNDLYKEACMKGLMSPGCVLVSERSLVDKSQNKHLVYVATKMDWRSDSKIEWIEHGLFNLVKAIYFYNIKSIAIPALGSGKGNLPWPSVEILFKTIFENDGLQKNIEVYLPH